MDYENILYERAGPIAVVTLNRPDKLNALSDDLQREVRHALHHAGVDRKIGILDLAIGKVFGGREVLEGDRRNEHELGC